MSIMSTVRGIFGQEINVNKAHLLNPDDITVEAVAEVFCCSKRFAKWMLDRIVARGAFKIEDGKYKLNRKEALKGWSDYEV